MARIIETQDGARIAELSHLKDFQVAEGYRDIRGWRVDSTDGREVGKVHDLLVDLDGMRTRYLALRLTSALAAVEGNRDVLVPIGAARIADDGDRVIVPLTAERVSLLPAYDHGSLTRAYESEIRRHFSLGEAAAASAVAATGAVAADAAASTRAEKDRGFYDNEAYDDRRFFTKRAARTADAADAAAADAARRGAGAETRIPVGTDDTVVLKRGEGGADEIIVRKPAP